MKKSNSVLIALLFFVARSAAPQSDGSDVKSGVKIQCANLIYGGNKTSQCFSDRFLTRLSTETKIQADPHFYKVRLDSPDLCRYPFAIMTGEGPFALTEKERTALRYYLTQGGFLLASAGCSDPRWIQAFRREFAGLFPGQKWTPLPLSHPLFNIVYKIDDLGTTHGLLGTSAAKLEAILYHGRVVALFSANGLNDSPHAVNCCCCGGDEIEKAEFINVNALAYSVIYN